MRPLLQPALMVLVEAKIHKVQVGGGTNQGDIKHQRGLPQNQLSRGTGDL